MELWKKPHLVGSGKQIKGPIKEAVGEIVGDAKLQIDGNADQLKRKVQNLVGAFADSPESV